MGSEGLRQFCECLRHQIRKKWRCLRLTILSSLGVLMWLVQFEGNFMRDELLCLRVLLGASLSITGSPPRSRNLPLFEFQRQYVASDLPPEPDRIICQRESAVEAPSRVLLATNANDCSIRDVSLPLVRITLAPLTVVPGRPNHGSFPAFVH